MVLKKTLGSPLDCKEIKSVHPKGNQSWHWKDWCWSWNSNTLATWCEELTHWKRPWCWERLKAGGERDDRGWDGWMASRTRWTWIGESSRSWWWTGKPGVLQSMGRQRVEHTEQLSQTDSIRKYVIFQKILQNYLTASESLHVWRTGLSDSTSMHIFLMKPSPSLNTASLATGLKPSATSLVLYCPSLPFLFFK